MAPQTDPLVDLHAEQALLSCAMVDAYEQFSLAELRKLLSLLQPEDFSDPRHQAVWRAAISVANAGGPIEGGAIRGAMERLGSLDAVDSDYFWSLADLMPTSTTLAYYGGIVRDLAAKRRLRDAGRIIAEQAAAGGEESASTLIADAEGRIREIPTGATTLKPRPLRELLDEFAAELATGHVSARTVATGLADLDRLLAGGLWPGQLVTVAARPGMGKTTLALGIASHAAFTLRRRVAFFSMEMRARELTDRILCVRANVDLGAVRERSAVGYDRERLEAAMIDLGDRDLRFYDEASQRVDQIAEAARGSHREKPLDLVVVDYLQLVLTAGKDTRAQEVADVTRGLKALAGEIGVPVLALSQLNRNAERDDRPPRLSDLRESGAIEQDSDVVLMLHRLKQEEGEARTPYDLIVGKQRNGPTDTLRLGFDASRVRFVDQGAL